MKIAVKQLEKLIPKQEENEKPLTINDLEDPASENDPRVQALLRSAAAREYLRQNPDADIINPGLEKADFVRFARDFDRGEEMEDRERFASIPASAKRPGGLFGRLPRTEEERVVQLVLVMTHLPLI